MLKTELRKKIFNRYFIVSFCLLLLMFLLGSAGRLTNNIGEETFISAVIAKHKGKWIRDINVYKLSHYMSFWNGNQYTTILMPIIVGLPGLGLYIEEFRSGNKRLILSRTSKRIYYCSKLISSALTAALISFLAVFAFWGFVYLFFDDPETGSADCGILYYMVFKRMPESGQEIRLSELNFAAFVNAIKSLFFFMIYSIRCAIFTQAISAIVRDSYLTLGITTFATYFHERASSALYNMVRDDLYAGKRVFPLYDIIRPDFQEEVFRGGYFENRALSAFLLTLALVFLWSVIFVAVSEKQTDVSAG